MFAVAVTSAMTFPAPRASAGDWSSVADRRPLLVLVETAAAGSCDARDVRRAISAELDAPVAALSDPAAREAPYALLVALEARQVSMSLRGGANREVSRRIPLPADPAAQLRAVAWLAGNLARDQVAQLAPTSAPPLLAGSNPGGASSTAAPAAAPAPAPAGVGAVPPGLPVAAPVRADSPAATEPPPVSPTAVIGDASGTGAPSDPSKPSGETTPIVDRAAGPAGRTTDGPWMVSAAAGWTATYADTLDHLKATPTSNESGWQLELQHVASQRMPLWGAALDASPSHVFGLAAFAGSTWRHRHWFLEGTAGVGFEVQRMRVTTGTVTNDSRLGLVATSETTWSFMPNLYARGVLGAGFPLSGSVDLLARASLHLATSGLEGSFVAATAGIRVRLPW
jgi:hypothetical protein